MNNLAFVTLLAMLAPTAAGAQIADVDTIFVTLGKKSPQHFSYGREWDSCFYLNGVEAAEPTLVRGRTYVFQCIDIPRRSPIYFRTLEHRQWFKGLSHYEAALNQSLIFTPPSTTPDILIYDSAWRFESGGLIHFIDSLTTGYDQMDASAANRAYTYVQPNPFSDHSIIKYRLPGAEVRLDVVDGLGRIVYSEMKRSTEEGGAFRLNACQIGHGFFGYRISGTSGASVSGTFVVVR